MVVRSVSLNFTPNFAIEGGKNRSPGEFTLVLKIRDFPPYLFAAFLQIFY